MRHGSRASVSSKQYAFCAQCEHVMGLLAAVAVIPFFHGTTTPVVATPTTSARAIAISEAADLAVAVRATAVAFGPIGRHKNHLLGVGGLHNGRDVCHACRLSLVQRLFTAGRAGALFLRWSRTAAWLQMH